MLLDSTFLIDLLRRTDEKATRKAEELDEQGEVKTISAVSVLELWRGALRSVRHVEEKEKINLLLKALHVYPVNELTAKKTAEMEALLLAQGERIDLEDIMIAATASVNDEPVLTRNEKHFKRIREIQVETY